MFSSILQLFLCFNRPKITLNKTLSKNEREMKRVARAGKPPVVIPVVVVAADAHNAPTVPAAEGHEIVQNASYTTTLRSLLNDLGVESNSVS